MKKLYWIVATSVLVLGLGISLHFALQPRAVPKIKLSHVESPERLGQAVVQRLRQEVQKETVFFVGVTPGDIHQMELLKGMMTELSLELNKIKPTQIEIWVEGALPYVELLDPAITGRWDLKNDFSQWTLQMQDLLKQHKIVVLVGPHIYSSQLLKLSPASRLAEQLPVMSFSVLPMTLTPEEAQAQNIQCATNPDLDPSGTAVLGCMAQNRSRLLARKKMKTNHFAGAMDQTGQRDYLILFRNNAELKP